MLNFLSDSYYKFKFDIRIYRNVLTEKERVELKKDSQRYLMDLGEHHPGLQTCEYLHELLTFENYVTLNKLLKMIGFVTIDMCWSNYSDSNLTKTCWHTHPVKLTSIYYLENPERLGTSFRVNGKQFQINVPTNTLMVIPGYIEHNAPSNVTKPRQCIVIDTND